ncbi:TELO2-interacting protein 2 isoform X2 [Bombina bombina]|uniref:TELO2-interacting protein 2 isoform X2 n=1 Tax=Bombina bombina TaxID=8345 RepID=UPI00235AF29C|nr:TELO2-interacting protein 2 isoform X2 [Bombina bombina]
MASPEKLFQNSLAELSLHLGRSPFLIRTLNQLAELLKTSVLWAAPGPEPESATKVPERVAAVAKSSLCLLESIQAASQEGVLLGCSGVKSESKRERVTSDVTSEHDTGTGTFGASSERLGESVNSIASDDQVVSKQGIVVSEELSNLSETDQSSSLFSPLNVLSYVAAPMLIFCGTHIQVKPWTNTESRSLTQQLLCTLLDVSGCKSVPVLLRGPDHLGPSGGIFGEALELLIPMLRKDIWESHPHAKVVFSWILLQVTRPWLSEFLARVVPPSLLFSDDYKTENKILGVSCLHHIIKNAPAADLRQYNHAQVIYHALRAHMYSTDSDVIEVVFPCLLDLFPVLQKSPSTIGRYKKEADNPSDEILQLVLIHMEMEHKIVLRRLYARYLPVLVERLGARVARHMKRLLRVIVGYLEVYDGPEEIARLCILKSLQETIKYAWPRIPCRLSLLLKALVKLLYEISCYQNNEPVTDALCHGATECLLLLDRCSKGQVKVTLAGISSVCKERYLVQCIERVQQES